MFKIIRVLPCNIFKVTIYSQEVNERCHLLTKRQAAALLKFNQEHFNCSKEKWGNILWTDESKIVLLGGTRFKQYVGRLPNFEYMALYTQKTVKHGGAKLMAKCIQLEA